MSNLKAQRNQHRGNNKLRNPLFGKNNSTGYCFLQDSGGLEDSFRDTPSTSYLVVGFNSLESYSSVGLA